ncbi:DUF4179 domain-containing protein [Ktedonobacter racemifer]|uniref:DUF4179 domain-containing protein n=1 Tax=Ktedonobacter racemifer DSM 44963 TaxID=485913 RepID=D6TH61_KTERA|nr:DUF4179 domain-containing protein [Ktedonobacter racemifer]EFH90803.1 hypothetical protein Krac_12442 [Ktedonobacter racemifer DSM 44963]
MKKFDIEQEYSDLLEQEHDQVTRTLLSDLHTAYTHPVPPLWLSWRTTKARYLEETLTKRTAALPRHFAPAHRFSLSMGTAIALLFVVVTLASASTFALSPQVREVLGLMSFGNPPSEVIHNSDYTLRHQSRTIGGVEVTLEGVYADQVEISIGFSTRSTSKNTPPIDVPQLRTKQGQTLPGYIGGITSESAQAWSYDATSITGNPRQLDLLLDISIGHERATIAFTAPFHPGKVIQFNGLQATSNGVTLTLDKMVHARSGTEFFIRGYQGKRGFRTQATLSSSEASNYEMSGMPEFKRVIYARYIPIEKSKNWSLTIKDIIPKGNPDTPKDAKPSTWTFNFQVS